ncbi:MAG: DUF1080 domain-containing protein [Spirosoma sp.]|nr:DUF1080 domain-containing protein [Spirosoma sp.]
MQKPSSFIRFGWAVALSCAGWLTAQAQPTPGTAIPLNDLSAFKPTAANWQITGSVRADLGKPNMLLTEKGTGVLVNVPAMSKKGQLLSGDQYNLQTLLQHGDADLELDYMMAPQANSGLYLQGRYEVQLRDSWDVKQPNVHDNGSVYERWDEKRPEGQKGYEGQAPRQNASRAPGLWQHMKISFQAPRFNAQGQKTENARVIRIELNGVVIQDDVEMTGPTRGATFETEQPTGPLLIQGDHGAVAFRNIRYVAYDKPRPNPNRSYVIGDRNAPQREPVDPILIDAPTNTILRSFMDVPGSATTDGKSMRVTHGVSVGSPDKVHYTYDLDKGAIVQVWRGDFLDATPMWHDRGDGSSRPMGMVQRMGTPMLFLSKLVSPQTTWTADTTGSGFRPKGYVLDPNDLPTFRYQSYGAMVDDKIRVLPNGQGIQREVSVTNPASGLYARLATGKSISDMNDGMFLVDGTEYVRIDNANGAKPIVRSAGDRQELILPMKDKVQYSILF